MRGLIFIYSALIFFSCSRDKSGSPLDDFSRAEILAGEVFFYPEEYDVLKPLDLMYSKMLYHAPEFEAPKTKGMPSVIFGRNNRIAFCDIASSDKYIYALYSGRTTEEFKEKAHECEHLLVYDQDGNPVKYFKLNIPLSSFAVCNGIIYGIGFNPEAVVIKYNMNGHILQ